MALQLVQQSLDELSDLEVAYFTCDLPSSVDAIVVRFTGECGLGSGSNGDCAFMAAMTHAGLEAWSPSALILDLSQLRYEWGDQMVSVLCAGQGQFIDAVFPTAVIVSELCRKGLSSLVEDEMGGDQKAKDWLFESLEDAYEAVNHQWSMISGGQRE